MQTMTSIKETVDTIREYAVQRRGIHRAEKAMTLRIKAIQRRADSQESSDPAAVAAWQEPFVVARAGLEAERKVIEKHMTKLAKSLPVYEWAEQVRGLGELGLALIIGATGDLSNYPTVAKVWKRLGLAVIGGERQRRVTGADAVEHGYNPDARSMVWTLGKSMVYGNIRKVYDEQENDTGERIPIGHYGEVYLDRKEYEAEREWCGKCLSEQDKKAKATRDHCIPAHIDNKAKRYMEKRMIRDLWVAWNGHRIFESQNARA